MSRLHTHRIPGTVFRVLLILAVAAVAGAQPGEQELVRVRDYIPDNVVDLKYATTDNFTGQVLYDSPECYLAYGAVQHLKMVQDSLRHIREYAGKVYPRGLGLKLWDGYRPHSVQFRMWEIVPDARYVADPVKGSIHNRGGAVDLTLVDFATQQELLMPTPFDFFGPQAHHEYDKLPADVIANRRLLKSLMETVGGFESYAEEWWHYNYPPAKSWPVRDETFP
jgi:D-alanyl-D-alanine dipeptidase